MLEHHNNLTPKHLTKSATFGSPNTQNPSNLTSEIPSLPGRVQTRESKVTQ